MLKSVEWFLKFTIISKIYFEARAFLHFLKFLQKHVNSAVIKYIK